MKVLKSDKAIFCMIAMVLVITQFIPITSASNKNTEAPLVPNDVPTQKLTFFSYVIIKSGTIGSFDFNPPVVNWRSNGEISITGLGDRYNNNGGQLAEGSLTLFLGSMTDSQIRGFALISVLFIIN